MEELLAVNYSEQDVDIFSSNEIVDTRGPISVFSCYALCPIA